MDCRLKEQRVSLYCASEARYPRGKGEVCKTFTRGFDSHPRLHCNYHEAAVRHRSLAHSRLKPVFQKARIKNVHPHRFRRVFLADTSATRKSSAIDRRVCLPPDSKRDRLPI